MALSGGVGHRRTAVTGRAARRARHAHKHTIGQGNLLMHVPNRSSKRDRLYNRNDTPERAVLYGV